MKSPAYRALSLSAHRIIARIRVELAHHAGKDNGKLPVTFRDFHNFGVRWNSISSAIREADALGFIRITRYGKASNAEFRIPNMFALTHLPTNDGQTAATDDWRGIKTIEEAEAIAEAARKAPARYGKFPKKTRRPKTDLRYRNGSEDGYRNDISTPPVLDTETVSLPRVETVAPSISRADAGTSILGASADAKPVVPADDWRRNSKTAAERLDERFDGIPDFLRRTVN